LTLAPGTDRLESERLVLRRITLDDSGFFARIQALPEVGRYIGPGRPRSAEESHAWIAGTLAAYRTLNLGQLAVVRKSDGELIGRCGLSDLVVEANVAPGTVPRGWFQRDEAPAGIELVEEPELGYTFDPASWGHGYATEAARCVFEYAREKLRRPRIVSVIHPDNVRSLGVAGRCGLRRDGQIQLVEGVLDRYVWPSSKVTVSGLGA
jgi:RimJ/RimL family protein N-acetyltransferase